MRSIILVLAFTVAAAAAAGDATGTVSYKGRARDFVANLKYAHFIVGPDAMDPTITIKRLILSSVDLTAAINACKTMDCADDDLKEGIEIDIDGGPRLNYWVVLNNQLVQHSGTVKPGALHSTTSTASRLAGTIAFDDSAAGGAKLDATFDAMLLKTFGKGR